MFGCFNYFRHGFLGGGMIMFLALILILVVLYFIFKKQQNLHSVKPIDLLNTRYINGDITKEEYEEKLEVLKKHQ